MRLTDTLAAELEKIDSNVLVFAVGPGFVDTEMTRLQADTEADRRWIPSSKEGLDAGNTRKPEDCAHATIKLLGIINRNLSGRMFGIGPDFEYIANNSAEIKEKDLYQMRSKP